MARSSPRLSRRQRWAVRTLRGVRIGVLSLTAAVAWTTAATMSPVEASAPPDDVEIVVAVDPRVELFSVLERLAGRPEYNAASTPYALAVDERFGPFRDDPAVQTLTELIATNGIGYDAAMTLAVHLDRDMTQLVPSQPLDPLPAGVDPRWEGVDLDGLLDEVAAFAAASRFDEFVDSQQDYIDDVAGSFEELVSTRPIGTWLDGIFGRPAGGPLTVVPGLLTGQMSYGVRNDGEGAVYAVMALESPDDAGVPTPGLLTEEYLVHEFLHSYVNPVIHDAIDRFDGDAPLLDEAAPVMAEQAYVTREVVVQESIVRALTLLYLRTEVGQEAANESFAGQVERGFVWTAELATTFDEAIGDGTLTDQAMIDAAVTVLMGS